MAATNYENYGVYAELAKNGYQEINTLSLTKDNIKDHILWVINIFRDGIETEEVLSMKLKVTFADGYHVFLYVPNYWFNLLWWNLIVSAGYTVYSRHIYFPKNMTNGYNKNYIDTWFIDDYYGKLPTLIMNNIIDDTLSAYRYINEFAVYFCNSLSLKDDIRLMRKYPEAYDIMHADLSDVPLNDYKSVGMDKTNRLVDIIKNEPDHWASVMFRTGEGINPKQFKENAVNIGPKPNGAGSIYPIPINSNLLYLGALKDLAYAIIDYSGGRLAQIINYTNVSASGSAARLAKLSTMDIHLHHDPTYICNTKNFIEIDVKDKDIFKAFINMTYRENPKGVDKVLTRKDTHLIGRKLYFRSAMTCASKARGEGLCYCCYGKLAYLNNDVNVGVLAAELYNAKTTQMMLSAKHILEAVVMKIEFDKEFHKFFKIEFNEVSINPKVKLEGYSIMVDTSAEGDDIQSIDEFDAINFNYYMLNVSLIDPSGEVITIDSPTELYLTQEFMALLKSYKNSDDVAIIPLNEINDSMFILDICNDELSAVLTGLQKIIDNSKISSSFTKDEFLQAFVEQTIKSRLGVNATHLAVLLSEQIRAKDNVIEYPRWDIPDVEYQNLAMKSSLRNNMSITKRLNFSYIDKGLASPLSFKLDTPSVMDLFFMTKPQEYLASEPIDPRQKGKLQQMVEEI